MEKSPITVLHIASGDLWAGAEVQLFTLANALKNDTDTIVHVILLNHGRLEKELIDCGVEVTVLDESKSNGFQILRKIIHIIKKVRPDVIHSHRSKENILGSIAALLVGNIPTLRTAHGAPEHKPAWNNISKRIILYLEWFCGRWLQKKIIAVSSDLAETLRNDFPADKIAVVENGINTLSYKNLVKKDHLKNRPSNIPFRIGIAGRLVPVKRVDIFIQAANKIFNDHPELNLSFHIFGDGPLRIELVTLNQKLKAKEIIHFEGHCEKMQPALAKLDLLLITSDHEGLPMVLLESMALKTPVIAHAVGGMPTVLNQGECGALIYVQQPFNYAAAIFELINNEEKREHLTKNAFNRIRDYYSSEKNAKGYHAIYLKLVSTLE
jgi:glycosyltransferase involved in cell wall biosynthesis